VLDFIGYLRYQAEQSPRPRKKPSVKAMTATDLLQSELVGLWADRDDIPDSVVFARQLRRQAEHRYDDPNVTA
jgi:hypothetical protein